MRETQQREERLRDEAKYLDAPVSIPTEKDKEDHDIPVAAAFFRPPRGIQSAYQAERHNGLLWRYPARGGSDFAFVELAFAEGDKEFASKILGAFQASSGTQQSVRNLTPPGRDAPSVFDVWDFDNGQEGLSVNILRSAKTQVAIVYVFSRTRRDAVRKAIELSLESLAIDGQLSNARQRYQQKSPWRLTPTP